jgi:hypothetical protein
MRSGVMLSLSKHDYTQVGGEVALREAQGDMQRATMNPNSKTASAR